MWHVDEGAIHAYLDGALDHLPATEAERIREHLASCDACAGRLEEERALRAEAQAILAGADPGVGDVPSLEELRLRAPSSPRRSPGVTVRRLGLAASLVLAVGTGWLLRGSQAPRIQDAMAPAPTRSQPVSQEAAEGPVAGEVDGAPTAPVPDEGAAAAARERAASPIRRGAAPLPEGAAPAVHLPVPSPATDLVDAARPVVSTAEAKRVAEDPFVADAATGAGAPGRGGALKAMEDSLAARLGEARVSPPEAKMALPPVSVLPPAPDAPPALTSAGRTRREQPRLDPVLADALARRRSSTEEAEAVRQASVSLNATAAVPGLPVLAVFQGEAGLPAGAVRILQSLNGDTLEVVHVPGSASEPDLPRRADDDRTQVSVRRGNAWLVARGRETRETLLRLLERVGG